jgi:hypothetical protein
MSISIEDLKNTVKDLQKVIDPEPPMKTDVSEKELISQILEASELIEEDDELKELTLQIIDGLKNPLQLIEKEKPSTENEDIKKPTENKKKKSKSKKIQYTRCDAFVDSLSKQPQTRKELIKKANDLYIKNGGKDNLHNSNTWFGIIMPAIIKMDIVIKNDKDKYYING